MRNMSFSMTTEAYRAGWKTVTRRLWTLRLEAEIKRRRGFTWADLKPGDVLMGVEKCQGLKRGERVKRMHPFRVMSNTMEPLKDIVRRPVRESGVPEVVLEGFPQMAGKEMQFVEMFCYHNGLSDWETPVGRIEFNHLFEYPMMGRVVA